MHPCSLLLHTLFRNLSFLPAERNTLLDIKNKWGNPPVLQSWNDTSSPCFWSGIHCSGGGPVTGVVLKNFNNGFVPDSISTLEQLRILDLGNSFMGNFPPAIFEFANLWYLDLSPNYFFGINPTSIDRLVSLEYLDLSGNNLTGNIPPEIGKLRQLRTLNLVSNLFDESYPKEIANLANLESLQLAYNNFVPAPIPLELGKLKKLKYLWMRQANVISELQESLVMNLTSLTHLDLACNKIQGVLPNALFSLKNLTHLYVWKNQLSGSIPHAIKSLDLVEIDLSQNNLTGRIPQEFGNLTKLELLNCFETSCVEKFQET